MEYLSHNYTNLWMNLEFFIFQYDKFIAAAERLVEHPFSFQIKDFLMKIRKFKIARSAGLTALEVSQYQCLPKIHELLSLSLFFVLCFYFLLIFLRSFCGFLWARYFVPTSRFVSLYMWENLHFLTESLTISDIKRFKKNNQNLTSPKVA